MENINKKIETFRQYLISEEKSDNTVEKYIRDVRAFREWCERRAAACCRREWSITKETVIAYKNHLIEKGYAQRSINSMLCSVNAFLDFSGRQGCRTLRASECFIPETKKLPKHRQQHNSDYVVQSTKYC